MREDEFSQITYGKRPALIYQYLHTQSPTVDQPTPSKFKKFIALKKWLFQKVDCYQPGKQQRVRLPKK